MKKNLLLIGALLVFCTNDMFGQKEMNIHNNTGCSVDITVDFSVHDAASGGCEKFSLNSAVTVPGATSANYPDLTALNDPLCIPAGAGPGWNYASPHCATTSGSWDWDRIFITVNGTLFSVANPSGCSSGSSTLTLSVLGCGSITVQWSIDASGDYQVAVY